MGFWQRPPLWVWLLVAIGLSLFAVSMVTLGEGLKFHSRPLQGPERSIVLQALECWSRVEPDLKALAAVRALLRQQRLRVMDEATFARAQERATLGYTDEHGRILLNPRICFATYRCVGRVHSSDVVRTTSVLVHEYRHCLLAENEEQACRAELSFVRRAWMAEQDSDWARQWQLWEQLVCQRVAPYLTAAERQGAGPQLYCPGKVRVAP